MSTGPRVVAIGGGHGLAMTLRAVDSYAGHLTAVVATGDDGGSSGRIRADLDLPAPGDLRRCLSAMAQDRRVADGLEHRFGHGELEGHAVGNLVLAGLVDAGHDLASAADLLSGWLGIDPSRTRIVPATQEPVTLVARTRAGAVRGQVAIETASDIVGIAFDPPDPAVPDEVAAAIGAAGQVVLGPGSFFTSVLGAAVVPTIAKAIAATDAHVVLIANLDTPAADQLRVLAAHGIDATAVVVQEGHDHGDLGPVTVAEGDVDRPHGLAHDATLLAPVLAALA